MWYITWSHICSDPYEDPNSSVFCVKIGKRILKFVWNLKGAKTIGKTIFSKNEASLVRWGMSITPAKAGAGAGGQSVLKCETLANKERGWRMHMPWVQNSLQSYANHSGVALLSPKLYLPMMELRVQKETHTLPAVFCNRARTTQWERHFKQKMLRRLDVYIQKNEVRFPLFTIHMELSHKGFDPIKLLEEILGDLGMMLTVGMASHEGRSTAQGKHINPHLTKACRRSTRKSKIQSHGIG